MISYQDLIGSLELESEFNQSITECRFAMASDILRVELLKAKGGAYLDIDLVTLQSLKPLFYLYDSIFHKYYAKYQKVIASEGEDIFVQPAKFYNGYRRAINTLSKTNPEYFSEKIKKSIPIEEKNN